MPNRKDYESRIEEFINVAIRSIENTYISMSRLSRPLSSGNPHIHGKIFAPDGNHHRNSFAALSDGQREYLKLFHLIFSLQPANPNNQQTVDAWNSLYVGDVDVLKNGIATICQNNQPGATIFIIGDRGAGKSSLQNQFFNNHNQWLQDELKHVWIRCDAFKLYGLWNLNNAGTFSISNYLNTQLAYIVLKYSFDNAGLGYQKNPLFEKVVEMLREKEIFIQGRSGEKRGKPDNLITQFIDKIKNERLGVVDVVRRIVQDYLKTGNRADSREYQNLISISDEIVTILNGLGYKFIRVVDGIDNISFADSHHKSYYTQAMKEVARLRHHGTEDILIFSMRPGTFHDFTNPKDGDNLTNPLLLNYPDPVMIMVEPSSIGEILKRKVDQAKNIEINIFKQKYATIKHRVHSTEKEELDDILTQVSNKYVQTLYDAIVEIMPELTSGSPESLVKMVLGHNIRALNRHKLTMLQMMLYDEQVRDSNMLSVWLMRNLFLSGKIALDSEPYGTPNDDDYMRHYHSYYLHSIKSVFPNLFYYNAMELPLDKRSHWHGLCGLRILQTVMGYGEDVTEDNIVEALEKYFYYNSSVIRAKIDEFMRYGVLEYDIRYFYNEERRKIMLRVSKKGEFLMKLALQKIDIMYYSALDTPLFIGSEVKVHDNRSGFHTNFTEAAVNTAIWFAMHVKSCDQREMTIALEEADSEYKRLKSEIDPHRNPIWRDVANFKKMYQLPNDFPRKFIKEDMNKMMMALLNEEKYDRLDEILNASLPSGEKIMQRR